MNNILQIKKLYDDVELPTMNSYGIFDIRVHSFHKINEYDGIVSTESNSMYLKSLERVMIKTGYSLHINQFPNKLLKIFTRIPCAIKDGLVVLGGEQLWYLNETSKELEVILYNSSDRAFVLQKGFRIAQGMIVELLSMRTEIKLMV